jgi:hypothetical protein
MAREYRGRAPRPATVQRPKPGSTDSRGPVNAVSARPRRACAIGTTYRAWIENRTADFELTTADDLDGLCSELHGLQREACITAASVIGPPDPVAQIELCADFATASDAASCIRGVKVQNLLGRPTGEFVKLVDRCAMLRGSARASCYRWLGKSVAVLTDGAFARNGCPRLHEEAARRECAAGAATMDEAVETFS